MSLPEVYSKGGAGEKLVLPPGKAAAGLLVGLLFAPSAQVGRALSPPRLEEQRAFAILSQKGITSLEGTIEALWSKDPEVVSQAEIAAGRLLDANELVPALKAAGDRETLRTRLREILRQEIVALKHQEVEETVEEEQRFPRPRYSHRERRAAAGLLLGWSKTVAQEDLALVGELLKVEPEDWSLSILLGVAGPMVYYQPRPVPLDPSLSFALERSHHPDPSRRLHGYRLLVGLLDRLGEEAPQDKAFENNILTRLRQGLFDSHEWVRLESAQVLAYKEKAAIPVLLGLIELASQRYEKSIEKSGFDLGIISDSLETLQKVTGQDFFRAASAEMARSGKMPTQEQIEAWRAWWEKNRATFRLRTAPKLPRSHRP